MICASPVIFVSKSLRKRFGHQLTETKVSFTQQPRNEEEVTLAMEALESCPVEAIEKEEANQKAIASCAKLYSAPS